MTNVRTRICNVTRNMFAKEGVEGLSMRRIAAEVGVTPTAIYRHFSNKDALVRAIVDEGFSLLEQSMRSAKRFDKGQDSLMAMLDCYVDFALAYPRYYDVMFLYPRTDVRRYPDDFQRRESVSFNLLMDLTSQTIESGEFEEDDVLETALSLWSHTHGFVALFRCGRFGEQPQPFRQAVRRSLRRLFAGMAA